MIAEIKNSIDALEHNLRNSLIEKNRKKQKAGEKGKENSRLIPEDPTTNISFREKRENEEKK